MSNPGAVQSSIQLDGKIENPQALNEPLIEIPCDKVDSFTKTDL